MRLLKSLCCAAALAVCLVPAAHADEWNKKTILTFSGPVQIPGATLAAGSYVFKLADLSGNRHVVQVFDKDEKHVYATILAIPDKRLEPTDDPVVLFAERPAGTPQAIRAWFYPGDTFGDEFVYPKSQAMKIAKASHTSVLATDDSTNTSASDNERMDSMRSAKVGRVDENGSAVADNDNNRPQATGTTASTQTPAAQQNRPASSPAPTTTTDDARLKNSSRDRSNTARATGTSGRQTASNDDNNNNGRRRRLPQTASNLALIELLGGLSIAGAFAVRRLRARLVDVR